MQCFVRTIFCRGISTFREILMISLSFFSTQDHLMGSQSTPGTQLDQNCISKTMKSILQSEGIEILDNPKRVRALLSDHCAGDWKREIILLERLLDEKIHLELIRQKNSVSYEVLSSNLTNRILANHPFDKDLVESGIDNLAVALEIIKAVPVRNSSSIKLSSTTRMSGGNVRRDSQNQLGFSESNPLINQAIKLNQSKSFSEAIDLLNQALKTEPENPVALREKAFAISNLGYYKESLHWFNNSLRVNTDDPITWIQKGYALSKMGKNNDAINCYDAAIRIDPDNAVVWRNRGFSLRKLKDYPTALQSYENALKINPQDPIAWKLKGGVLGLMKKYHEAFQATKHALTLDPHFIEAMMNMGWLLSDQERYQEAIEWYDNALKIDHKNSRALKQREYCLKKIYVQSGQKKYPPIITPLKKKAPTPENQGIMDKLKGFFK